MKIKTRICIITTISLIICCVGLWGFNYFSTNNLINDIKEIESCDEKKTYAKLIAIEDTGEKNFKRLFISLLFVVTIGGITSFFAITKALKPVKNLTEKIKSFHTSDLQTPIPLPKSKDESYELISSFNSMLNILNQAFQREKRITANIAHEFKTPLSVLITSCEVLEMKDNPSIEDYKKVIDITKSKAEYLSEITTSLLSIHRQTQKINNTELNLYDLLLDIKKDLSVKANEKNIDIKIQCSNIKITCDKLLFSQMLNNFIENAIKYNKNNGKVEVLLIADEKEGTSIKIDKKSLIIKISDTGFGIPDSAKKLVFEPFYRIDKSRNKEYGGVGLGLPFAKTVADMYRGNIKIEDNKPEGTIITLTFPNMIP